MIFGIYDPPRADARSWTQLKIGDICDAVEFNYTKYFCGAGTFTLIIPRNSVFADKIYVGCFLIKESDGGAEFYDGFIVKNIVYENDTLKITGYDLNGLLLDRVILYPQESADKALSMGSTEKIVKYYVDYNCVSSTDEERNFPKLGIAENQDRGIANDAASPRLECVADVIADILGAQQMGYRITPLFNVTGDIPIMEFEVYEAVDRTQNQDENSRVTFSFGLGNVAQMKREVGVTADKNTFYCEIDSGAVQRYYKKGEEDQSENDPSVGEQPEAEEKVISGYDRREEYLKLSCELGELQIYAEHEIADRYRLTDSLEITAGNPIDYGSVYNVGDIVTVYDRERELQLDSIISAAEIKHTGTEYTVRITLGDSKPKVLDSYAKKGQSTASVVRNMYGVGRPSDWDNTSEYFNRYTPKGGNVAGIKGQKNCYAHAEGLDTKALGVATHAEGSQNSIEGNYCHIEGFKNKSSGHGNSSIHIEGSDNTFNASNVMGVHIEGYNNSYNGSGAGSYIHIEGSTNRAGGWAAHAEGQGNTIEVSDYAHVEGMGNDAANSPSGHIEGQFNTLKQSGYTHAEGFNNTAEGSSQAHAEGQGNTLTGASFGHAEGMSNTLTGASFSHIGGAYNKITGGSANHAEGMYNTTENASFASVGGMSSTIEGGQGCFAHGVGLDASAKENVPTVAAFGQYNDNADKLIFMIGNGTGGNDRKNAFAVDSDGNIYITGDVFINGVKLNLGGN